MRSPRKLRFAATTTAILALGLVLGGTVFSGPIADAATAINGSRLVNHSVKGKKLGNNTLTGTQINESTLGTVPNAARLGGQAPSSFLPAAKLFSFSTAMNGAVVPVTRTIGTIGPLTFSADCQVSGSTFSTIDVVSSRSGVVINGLTLTAGVPTSDWLTNDGSAAGQHKTFDVVAVEPATGFAAEGSFASVIATSGANCRFLGHLVRVAG